MLERTTIYVDTSYLLASFYNSWEEGAREQLEVSLATVVHTLSEIARSQVNQPVHRQFWYDGVPESGPHRYQRTLRVIDGVILRTGQLIEWGSRRSQKAVDTRLVADMVQHAMRGQCTDMVLVSGDADMIPGVEAAVEAGVRVHLVGFGWDSISSALRNSCDTSTVLDPRTDFADSMQIRVLEGPLPPQVRHPRPSMPGEDDPHPGDEPVDLDDVDFRAERAKDDSVAEVREKMAAQGTGHSKGASDPADSAEGTASSAEAQSTEDAQSSSSEDVSGDDASSAAQHSKPAVPGAKPKTPGEQAEQDDPAAISRPASERGEPRTHVDAGAISTAATCPADDREDMPEADAETAEEMARSTGAVIESVHSAAVKRAASGDVLSDSDSGDAEAEDGELEPQARQGRDGGARVRVTRTSVTVTSLEESSDEDESRPTPRPNPSMMAPRRRPVRSRYVPLSEEVWSSSGEPTPYDVGQQYAMWWFKNAADEEQRGKAHTLTGGALPPEVDRPLLQFACQTLHEFTLNEYQRVALRDGFHEGIRTIIMRN